MKTVYYVFLFIMILILTSCIFNEEVKDLSLEITFKDDYVYLKGKTVPSIKKYEIYRRELDEEEYKFLTVLNSDTIEFKDFGFSPHTKYIYQVVGYNDNSIVISEEKRFDIPNRLPEKVIPDYPEKNQTVNPKSLNINWTSSKDPDEDELEYKIYLTVDNTIISSITTNNYYKTNLKYGKTYSLRIDVYDGYDTIKGDEITFNTSQPPEDLNKPEISITNVSTETIELQWQIVANATNYELYRKEGDNEFEQINNNIKENYYTDRDLKRKIEYTYKIRAIRKENNEIVETSPFSDEISAVTKNNSPETPVLIYPTNNATNINLKPTFKWQCTDPDGDAITYKLYLSDNKNAVENEDINAMVKDNLRDTEFEYKGLYINKDYYWKVVAIDEYDDISKSEIYKFTTKNVENNTPILSIPDQNMTEDSTLILNLNNYASDEDNDELTFYLVSGPGTIVTTGDSTNYIYYADYDSEGSHEIKISVTDGLELTQGIFTIIVENKNRPPETPSNFNPRNGSEDVEIKNLTLSWNCVDPDNDYLKYTLYFSKIREDVENRNENAKIIDNYAETSYTLESILNYKTTYYWMVVASDGNLESQSFVGVFTTKDEPSIIEVSDISLNINETKYATIATKKVSDINALEFELNFDPKFIEIDTTKGASGVEFLREDIHDFFENITLNDSSIEISIASKKNISELKGDIIKIYFKAKKSGETTLKFKNAEGVRLLGESNTKTIEFNYSDTGKVIIN